MAELWIAAVSYVGEVADLVDPERIGIPEQIGSRIESNMISLSHFFPFEQAGLMSGQSLFHVVIGHAPTLIENGAICLCVWTRYIQCSNRLNSTRELVVIFGEIQP